MPDQKLKVFISMRFTGKTFEALTAEREALHALATKYGFELPEQFIGYQFEEDFKTKDYDPSFVLAKDKNYIKESDIVIADFTDPGFGTCAEVTIAKELYDKKVIGIVPEEKRNGAWRRFYFDHFVSSFEEAFELAKRQYAGYKHPEHIDKRQYDSIAVEYQLVEATFAQKYVYDPNARALIEEYGKGKKVGVFHAATGHRARLAKEGGAAEIVALDSSFRQINIAREIEISKKQGIEYHVLNAYSKDFLDLFPEKHVGALDAILGFFLIDHAQSEMELRTLAQNLHASLAEGGIFMAMLDAAETPIPTDPKYGVAIEPFQGETGDGAQRKIVIYQNMKDGEDRPVLHFYNFAWTRPTVERIFSESGFSGLSFRDPFIAEEGEEHLGTEFWTAYRKNPANVIFTARK